MKLQNYNISFKQPNFSSYYFLLLTFYFGNAQRFQIAHCAAPRMKR